MGRRGPPPKPTALKLLQGNPGQHRLNQAEPKPASVVPNRPGWLLPNAKREWSRLVQELQELGLLTNLDRAALAGYCQAYARAIRAEAVIEEKGETFLTPNGYEQQRPE